MEPETFLPSQSFKFLKLEVVSWNGPVVEIHFERPIESVGDVEAAVREATTFMRSRVSPRAGAAFFVTCYDGLTITRDNLKQLREKFIDFNSHYSRGDVRYGGGHVARTFVVSTAIDSGSRSNHFETRPEALAAVNQLIREAR